MFTFKATVFVAVLLVAVALSACAPAGVIPASVPTISPTAAATLSSRSGIRGTVTIGPTCPGPERPGEECTRPYVATLIVTRRDGTEVGRVTSGEDGRFSIELPPGEYTIVPQKDSQSLLPRAASIDVSVPANEFAEVDISFDTGIR